MKTPNQVLYTKYPVSSILIYNGATVAYYALGGIGLFLGYESWIGFWLGSIYLVFSFIEMYINMPMKVCRNCVYYKLGGFLVHIRPEFDIPENRWRRGRP